MQSVFKIVRRHCDKSPHRFPSENVFMLEKTNNIHMIFHNTPSTNPSFMLLLSLKTVIVKHTNIFKVIKKTSVICLKLFTIFSISPLKMWTFPKTNFPLQSLINQDFLSSKLILEIVHNPFDFTTIK